MLVLKRYLHEVVRIGPDVTVEVVRIEGGVVTLGVMAPPRLKISLGDAPPVETESTSNPWHQPCADCTHPRGFHGRRNGHADKCVGAYGQPPCLCLAFGEAVG